MPGEQVSGYYGNASFTRGIMLLISDFYYLRKYMIKKPVILILFLTIISVFCKAQPGDKDSLATVYFFRSTGITAGKRAFNVYIDDSLVCHLNNNLYTVHLVRPGSHRLQTGVGDQVARKKIQALDILMKAGETYYISVDVTDHDFYANLYLMEITLNTAKKMITSLKEVKNCK